MQKREESIQVIFDKDHPSPAQLRVTCPGCGSTARAGDLPARSWRRVAIYDYRRVSGRNFDPSANPEMARTYGWVCWPCISAFHNREHKFTVAAVARRKPGPRPKREKGGEK